MLTKAQIQGGIKICLQILVAITVVAFIIAPYVHVFLEKTSTEKIFGFKNLKFFMYVIGLPMSLFLCSTLLLVASKFIKEKFVKVFFTTISFLFVWSSFFQFVWIFWQGEDLSKFTYYFSIFFLSAVMSLCFRYLINARKSYLLKLQNIVHSLSRFSFINAKKFIKEDNKESYDKELLVTLKKSMKL